MGNSVVDTRRITILVASETGNSLDVGEALESSIAAFCPQLRLIEAVDYDLDELEREDILLMVTSTQGEGEPPYGAEDLYDAVVMGKREFSLRQVSFAVLGLGDSAYAENYNLMARQFDARYEQLGATRLLAHGECDFDYEETAAGWVDSVTALLRHELGAEKNEAVAVREPAASQGHTAKAALHETGAKATLVGRELLSSPEARKHVYRVRLRLSDDADYLPGDLLAITYRNADDTVKSFIEHVFTDVGEQVSSELRHTLQNSRDITRTTPRLILRYAEVFGNEQLQSEIGDDEWLRGYAARHPPYALFTDYPARIRVTPESVLEVFSAPCRRMYSISNIRESSDGLVDLTVRKVEYTFDGRRQVGECSRMLTQAPMGSTMDYAVLSNERFRLPANQSAEIVMIALGSAIAPYRAFLQERSLHHASFGRNWLIVGNKSPEEDYLYRTELEQYADSGLLRDLSVAWSRFGNAPKHVQDVMIARGDMLWQLIQSGAFIYLCGHGRAAVRSIEQALRRVIEEHSSLSDAEIAAYMDRLKSTNHLCY